MLRTRCGYKKEPFVKIWNTIRIECGKTSSRSCAYSRKRIHINRKIDRHTHTYTHANSMSFRITSKFKLNWTLWNSFCRVVEKNEYAVSSKNITLAFCVSVWNYLLHREHSLCSLVLSILTPFISISSFPSAYIRIYTSHTFTFSTGKWAQNNAQTQKSLRVIICTQTKTECVGPGSTKTVLKQQWE